MLDQHLANSFRQPTLGGWAFEDSAKGGLTLYPAGESTSSGDGFDWCGIQRYFEIDSLPRRNDGKAARDAVLDNMNK